MERASKLAATVYPWALAAGLIATMLTPVLVGPGATSAVSLLLSGALVAVGAFQPRRISTPVAVVTLLGVITVSWYVFTSLRALNPVISLVGMIGQHNGVALLVLGLCWLLAGATVATSQSLRIATQITAVSGGIFTAAVLLEIAQRGLSRTQGFAAGFFDNSSSLGQYLAIATIAAAAWAMSEKSKPLRWTAWALGASSLGGIVLSSSRTGLLGVAVGAALALAVVRIPKTELALRIATATVASAPVVLTAILAAASKGVLGGAAQSLLGLVGTDRDAIWSAAVDRIAVSPLIGSGLQQFSAWISWSATGGTPTTDPHNAILALLLGGGVVGALAAGALWVAITYATLRIAQRSGSIPVALIMATPSALLATSLVSWTAPTALTVAAGLAGAGVGVATLRTKDPRPTRPLETGARVGMWSLAALAVVASMLTFSSLPQQSAFSTAPTPEALSALYARWPDPAFALVATNASIESAQGGDAEATRRLEALLAASERDARWRVDLAGSQLIAARTLYAADPDGFDAYLAIARRGLQADPSSGVWDVLAANEAARRGMVEEAARFARRALTYELDDETRATMEGLAR